MNVKIGANPVHWHTISREQTIQTLKSNVDIGLSDDEVKRRREIAGPNQLATPPGKPWWKEIKEELTEPMILLLILVAVVYGFLGELRDAITIIVIIIAVLAIEMGNESRAKGAIKALSKFTAIRTPVIRDASFQECLPSELVPGDIVVLRPGERIPADLRLLESISLQVDESSLTGESVPVLKDAKAVLSEESDLGGRRNLAYSGTLVTAGKGIGVVIHTGMTTELGKIVGLVQEAREPRTPLQLHMKELTRWMVWIALGFSALVAIVGWIQGAGWRETILTGLTLAFATIPEELPILIAMVLGLGAYRLSRQKAIVRRLRTAELLGNITVVATDKTGTLTENRMHINRWVLDGQPYEKEEWKRSDWTDRAIQVGCLANDGFISEKQKGKSVFEGDPTDTAFLLAAEDLGYDVETIRKQYLVKNQFPFDDVTRRITVSVVHEHKQLTLTKGAHEQLLDICKTMVWNNEMVPLSSELHYKIMENAEILAEEGYRVIGLAFKETSPDALMKTREQAESDLVFLGLAALYDPPRADVAAAVETLKQAGVRVMMVTGDHAVTAAAIAAKVGLESSHVLLGRDIETMSDVELGERLRNVSICARTTPEHKLRIVRALQQQGEVVAVTGDGVNDGPALKEAAVGIAMGKSGTDVAKESADMVLADDHFATVSAAIKEGRKLFANLHKAVRYYLAAKVALISSTLIAAAAGLSLPFAPIQIIIMELFMDLGAATSFTAERQEADGMRRSPRSQASRFMDRAMVLGIFSGGFSLGLAVLAAYLWALSIGADTVSAQSVAFAAWMIGHLILALIMRSEREPLFKLGLFSNRIMLLWISSAIVFLVAAVYVPYLSELLHLTSLRYTDWVVVLICSLIAPAWIEIGKWIRW
ncbi:cation-translocating P-type ATPase [Cohnella nanjingensis]|uniref:Cation-transporting P-type ATPase n=1 Tax=Cohnella nanjingensis TaxID=1387779 RepID=A0A7X0RKW0_9BACL|nr:cation-transporting P-type ATPase [Cohnella nanjingensis]MBB6669305.1 cation-transporting P-type ATPase [Cohnella nanjingensis]